MLFEQVWECPSADLEIRKYWTQCVEETPWDQLDHMFCLARMLFELQDSLQVWCGCVCWLRLDVDLLQLSRIQRYLSPEDALLDQVESCTRCRCQLSDVCLSPDPEVQRTNALFQLRGDQTVTCSRTSCSRGSSVLAG